MTSNSKKILEYRKTHSRQETAEAFNLTPERIRQIDFSVTQKRCPTHDRLFYNSCSFCLAESYKKLIRFSDLTFILNEVEREAKNRKRDYLSTQRRIILIQTLRERYEKNFSEIARLLRRHHSTIMYLYYDNA